MDTVLFTFPPFQHVFIKTAEDYYSALAVSKHFSGDAYMFIAFFSITLEASLQLLFFLDVTYITRDLPP